ncbi:MAG: hypothetical protein KDD62_09460, partial [Bdellovibrionales bacterium]|nr:hypothetical protein [Bdellovibrionales bacterium]
VLSKAKLDWTDDGKIRVLYVQGTPYERGYQHGALLRKEVQENFGYLYQQVQKKFKTKELFAEAYERLRPYIPQEYIEEMHGLAHGAQVPLEMIHHLHALPSITEWGGKKKLKEIVRQMMDGSLGPMCSNVAVLPAASKNHKLYAVRVLDWGLHRMSRLHQFPLITVNRTNNTDSVVVGWVGFLGAVSGMSARGLTLGEMGYGDPEYETLRGMPMIFLLREVLDKARSLGDAERLIERSPGTNSFAYVISDAQSQTAKLFIKDSQRFMSFKPGVTMADRSDVYPAIPGVVYGGHFDEKMYQILSTMHGELTPENLMEKVVPEIAMKSNFHNVIYDPQALWLWTNNAKSSEERAAEQPYTFFDFSAAQKQFPSNE